MHHNDALIEILQAGDTVGEDALLVAPSDELLQQVLVMCKQRAPELRTAAFLILLHAPYLNSACTGGAIFFQGPLCVCGLLPQPRHSEGGLQLPAAYPGAKHLQTHARRPSSCSRTSQANGTQVKRSDFARALEPQWQQCFVAPCTGCACEMKLAATSRSLCAIDLLPTTPILCPCSLSMHASSLQAVEALHAGRSSCHGHGPRALAQTTQQASSSCHCLQSGLR